MNAYQRRAVLIRLRDVVPLSEAAYLLLAETNGFYDDAVGLLVDAARGGKLPIVPQRTPNEHGMESRTEIDANTLVKPDDVEKFLVVLGLRNAEVPRLEGESWIRRELWTLIEAAQLVAGREPIAYSLVRDSHESVAERLDDLTGKLFIELYRQSKDANDLGTLRCLPSRTGAVGNKRVFPAEYVNWAHGRGFEVPVELASLLTTAPADWPLRSQTPSGDVHAALPDVSRASAADAQPQPSSASAPKRQDALAIELDELLLDMDTAGERITGSSVFMRLKRLADAGDSGCVNDVSADGKYILWERTSGVQEKTDVDGLQKRINRWRGRKVSPAR